MSHGDHYFKALLRSIAISLPSIGLFGRVGSRVLGRSEAETDYDILAVIDKSLRKETTTLWNKFISCVEETRDNTGEDILLVPSMNLEQLCLALRREREDTASTLIVHLLAYPTVDALRRWETPDIINGFARTLDLTQGNFIGKPQIVLNLAEQLKRKMQPSDYMWAHMNRLLSAQILMANISLGETNISLNSLKAAKYCLRHFTNFFLVRDYKLDPDDLKTWEKTLESARAKEVSWVPLLERVRGMERGELSSNVESLREVYLAALNHFTQSLLDDLNRTAKAKERR